MSETETTTVEAPVDNPKMDMALDDIVKTMKKPRRGGGRGRGGRKGGRGRGGGAQQISQTGEPKILISNLHVGVSDADISELFSAIGGMKSAVLHYDKAGRSLGTGHITYGKRVNAVKAAQQFNGVHLDGQPMVISIVSGAGPQGMVGRLSRGGGGGGKGRGGRGRGGRGRGGAKREPKTTKTAEELDAEMDAYLDEASKEKDGEDNGEA